MDSKDALLHAEDISVRFKTNDPWWKRPRRYIQAVDGVSLRVHAGETLALVGESGCGKTSLARALMGLYKINTGKVYWKGDRIDNLPPRKARQTYKHMRMIFQDPFESLNARHDVTTIIEEPLLIHSNMTRMQRRKAVYELLELVGLPESAASRFPHEFSGGQRQRIGIARALALQPELIICDEPVSALDVSIQAQIVNLLLDLQQKLGVSYLLIAHGLPFVNHMADRIAVMYLGSIVEQGLASDVYHRPLHPYTKALMASIPQMPLAGTKVGVLPQHIPGEIGSPLNLAKGCRFHERCNIARSDCSVQKPELTSVNDSRQVACPFAG